MLALVPSLVIPAMSPTIGEHYTVIDTLVQVACLIVAGSAWFVFTVLLSTIFRDVWRPMLLAAALALITAVVEFSSGIGPFHVMNAASYFRLGQMPWIGLLVMAALTGALWSAADRNYHRQDI